MPGAPEPLERQEGHALGAAADRAGRRGRLRAHAGRPLPPHRPVPALAPRPRARLVHLRPARGARPRTSSPRSSACSALARRPSTGTARNPLYLTVVRVRTVMATHWPTGRGRKPTFFLEPEARTRARRGRRGGDDAVPERVESIAAVIEPVVTSLGLELFDVELTGRGSRPGRSGSSSTATAASTSTRSPRRPRRISPVLDATTPALSGPYTLEVSSPGLERPLRTPEHFRRAVGETVSVKARDADGAVRRRRGVLVAADDDGVHARRRRRARERVAYADDHPGAHGVRVGRRDRQARRGTKRKKKTGRRRTSMNSEMMEALENIEREKGISDRDHARGAGERARHRLQAHARRRRGGAGRDRRRDRRHPA